MRWECCFSSSAISCLGAGGVALTASADGKVVVAGGKDGVLRVWDAASRSLRAAFGPEEAGRFAELGSGVE